MSKRSRRRRQRYNQTGPYTTNRRVIASTTETNDSLTDVLGGDIDLLATMVYFEGLRRAEAKAAMEDSK